MSKGWQDRRESNPQPPVLETGALPIELLSYFTFNRQSAIANLNGRSRSEDRRLTIDDCDLFRLFVRRMLAAEAAELAELQPLRRLLLVLGRAVIAPLTVLARQRDDVSHGSYARNWRRGGLVNW